MAVMRRYMRHEATVEFKRKTSKHVRQYLPAISRTLSNFSLKMFKVKKGN